MFQLTGCNRQAACSLTSDSALWSLGAGHNTPYILTRTRVHVRHADAGLAGLTNSLGEDGAGCGHNRFLVVSHVFEALGVVCQAGLGRGGGSIDCRVGGGALQGGLGAVGVTLLPLTGLAVLVTRIQVCGCGC